MLDKVTRWVLCLPDNTMSRSEGHVPLLPLQLIKQQADKVETVGSLFSVAIMSEYSYAT